MTLRRTACARAVLAVLLASGTGWAARNAEAAARKPGARKSGAPKSGAPKSGAPKSEEPKSEEPKPEGPKPVAVRLADGTELIHVYLPNAEETSLRWVVRSGGAADPAGKSGLAHLLEHLVFHGSYRTTETQLFAAARGAGAQLNAHTTPDYTEYILDAPTASFPTLVEAFVGVVTNPALEISDLERERGVVTTESAFLPEVGLLSVADQLLFAGAERGSTLIGSERSRDAIDRRDLAAFYAEHYIPANTSVIVVGGLGLERARELLDSASHLPPSAPSEGQAPLPGELILPLAEEGFAPYPVSFFGYALDDVDRGTCEELAALVDLRLMLAAEIERPLAGSIETLCYHLRGHDFLFAVTASNAPESALDGVVRATFKSAAKKGPSSKERSLLQARMKHAHQLLKADARGIADALVPRVAVQPASGAARRFEGPFVEARFEREALVEAAKRSFRSRREVKIRLSPRGS